MKKAKITGLSKAELDALRNLLFELSDRFSDEGYSDMELDNTPENFEMAKNTIKCCYSKEAQKQELGWLEEDYRSEGATLSIFNIYILDYLMAKLGLSENEK